MRMAASIPSLTATHISLQETMYPTIWADLYFPGLFGKSVSDGYSANFVGGISKDPIKKDMEALLIKKHKISLNGGDPAMQINSGKLFWVCCFYI
jgi:hypothetical protein